MLNNRTRSLILGDHVVASTCWRWHFRTDEQISLQIDYWQIQWGKSSSLASVNMLKVSEIWITKSLLTSVPFSHGLGTSLLLVPSRVKNVVIGNDSSTPNRDCWHNTFWDRKFWKCFPNFWAGPGSEATCRYLSLYGFPTLLWFCRQACTWAQVNCCGSHVAI